MSEDPTQQLEKLHETIATAMREHWKILLAQGVIMMILGVLAVLVPNVATLAIEIVIGALFLIGGLIRLFTLGARRSVPGYWWAITVAVLAVILGVLLLAKPLEGTVTLTIILVAFFVAEGILSILVAFQIYRPVKNWLWILISGLVDLLLAYLIWLGWPDSAAWAIGLLVGINMFFFGLSLAMTAVAARTAGPKD